MSAATENIIINANSYHTFIDERENAFHNIKNRINNLATRIPALKPDLNEYLKHISSSFKHIDSLRPKTPFITVAECQEIATRLTDLDICIKSTTIPIVKHETRYSIKPPAQLTPTRPRLTASFAIISPAPTPPQNLPKTLPHTVTLTPPLCHTPPIASIPKPHLRAPSPPLRYVTTPPSAPTFESVIRYITPIISAQISEKNTVILQALLPSTSALDFQRTAKKNSIPFPESGFVINTLHNLSKRRRGQASILEDCIYISPPLTIAGFHPLCGAPSSHLKPSEEEPIAPLTLEDKASFPYHRDTFDVRAFIAPFAEDIAEKKSTPAFSIDTPSYLDQTEAYTEDLLQKADTCTTSASNFLRDYIEEALTEKILSYMEKIYSIATKSSYSEKDRDCLHAALYFNIRLYIFTLYNDLSITTLKEVSKLLPAEEEKTASSPPFKRARHRKSDTTSIKDSLRKKLSDHFYLRATERYREIYSILSGKEYAPPSVESLIEKYSPPTRKKSTRKAAASPLVPPLHHNILSIDSD
jgi:hypothetical protein